MTMSIILNFVRQAVLDIILQGDMAHYSVVTWWKMRPKYHKKIGVWHWKLDFKSLDHKFK